MTTENKSKPQFEEEGANIRAFGEALKEHPFLDGLTPHQHRILSDGAREAHFNAGELIFSQGDPAGRFYLIRRGKVALEAHVQEGSREVVQTIETGDVLGWAWLFPPHFWHFNARALEPTAVWVISGPALRQECEADHELGYELTRRIALVMLNRLQATRRQLVELRARAVRAA